MSIQTPHHDHPGFRSPDGPPRMMRQALLSVMVAFSVLTGCAAVTLPRQSAAIAHPRDAASAEAEQLAAWQERMVRPCAKSGGRLVC